MGAHCEKSLKYNPFPIHRSLPFVTHTYFLICIPRDQYKKWKPLQILRTGRDWIQGIGCLPNSRKNWHCVFWGRSPCLTLTSSPHPQNSTGVKSITQPSLCSCDVATGRSHLGSYCCNCSMALWQLHKLLSYLDPCLPKGTRNSSKSRKMAFSPHFQLTSLAWM